jgi:hypothetical protein
MVVPSLSLAEQTAGEMEKRLHIISWRGFFFVEAQIVGAIDFYDRKKSICASQDKHSAFLFELCYG